MNGPVYKIKGEIFDILHTNTLFLNKFDIYILKMKKFFIFVALNILFINNSFAENYYFKTCGITEAIIANYSINFEEDVIDAKFLTSDGKSQKFKDKILLITDGKIYSEIIKNKKDETSYLQYVLDSEKKTISRQRYKKKDENDIFRPLGPTITSNCAEVKAGWNLKKINKKKADKKKKKEKVKPQVVEKESTLPMCEGDNKSSWNECQGTYELPSGVVFSGDFNNGQIRLGKASYPGGSKYIGQFINEKPNGEGTFIYSNGTKYFGNWRDGKGNGNGIKTWKNGNKYVGKFLDDKFDGQGSFFYRDGSQYVGNFKSGKQNGDGTFTYSNGGTFVGKFINGEKVEGGSCFNQNGSDIDCKDVELETKGMPSKKAFGKGAKSISVVAKKWVRISEYENNSGKKFKKVSNKLVSNFEKEAAATCSESGSYKILNKKLEVLEVDETPSYGLEAKVLMAITGVIRCE